MSDPIEFLRQAPDLHYTETPPPIDAQEFRKVITSRRSVRVFDGSPIPEEVTRECLELALLAPNSSNLQPWEFYWVRSSRNKARLVQACLSQSAAATAPELIVCVARTKTWKANAKQMLSLFEKAAKTQPVPKGASEYYRKLVPLVYGQGPFGALGLLKKVVFFIRGVAAPTPREPTSDGDMKIWASKTVALGAQTLMLAFRAFGFDTCPMEGFDSRRVARLLDLPGDAFPVMVIAAGRRASNGIYGPRIRFDRKQFVKEI